MSICRKVPTFWRISSSEYPCSSIISCSSMHLSSTLLFRSWSKISLWAFLTRLGSVGLASSSDLCQVPEALGWVKPLAASCGDGILAPLLQTDIAMPPYSYSILPLNSIRGRIFRVTFRGQFMPCDGFLIVLEYLQSWFCMYLGQSLCEMFLARL